jgi:hypothetical protein
MNNKMLIVAIAAVVATVIILYFCGGKKAEPYENLRIIHVNRHLYSEPNLECQLGSRDCRLSTGPSGMCDVLTRRCVEIPDNAPEKTFRDERMAPPIGEKSEECQWRGVCTRRDNGMGVCMSGLCYPATHVAT